MFFRNGIMGQLTDEEFSMAIEAANIAQWYKRFYQMRD